MWIRIGFGQIACKNHLSLVELFRVLGFFLIGKQEELFRALCYKLGFLVAVIIIIIIIHLII